MEEVLLPPMPASVLVEDAPEVAAAIDALLDETNPSFRKDFVCEVYIVVRREGSDKAGIFQVSPQVRQ
jgi:hypothetical protein